MGAGCCIFHSFLSFFLSFFLLNCTFFCDASSSLLFFCKVSSSILANKGRDREERASSFENGNSHEGVHSLTQRFFLEAGWNLQWLLFNCYLEIPDGNFRDVNASIDISDLLKNSPIVGFWCQVWQNSNNNGIVERCAAYECIFLRFKTCKCKHVLRIVRTNFIGWKSIPENQERKGMPEWRYKNTKCWKNCCHGAKTKQIVIYWADFERLSVEDAKNDMPIETIRNPANPE